jgi:hypothetical protein
MMHMSVLRLTHRCKMGARREGAPHVPPQKNLVIKMQQNMKTGEPLDFLTTPDTPLKRI